MIRKKNKKGAIFQDKIPNTIIIILVVVVVLFFAFKSDIKKLVDYIIPDLSQDTNLGNETANAKTFICESVVAEIEKPEETGKFSKGKQYIYVDNEKTNLFWDDKKQQIKIDKNVPIASINQKEILVYDEFLNENSLDYREYKSELPSMVILESLNGSYYFPGNKLCRATIKVEQENV